MHFKQIEMHGFKSFADRTTINLEQGMTAVVGPNGCGKSNILDATRWALGEQSAKQLRGAHMQDVVFNGSEDRAPMGMAEVTLTFDNADGALPIEFAEVQVTRRVYRSGESEYFINKSACRLRDIQELFMDTGIGTNAYSMIGQGKISMVLSSKPDDRRYLFEEAAGIIKYKSRKRVAMRKLDQAEQNQLRLGDVIAEIQRQMRSLKRQVNAAERHRELTGQLRDLEIRASWKKYQTLSAEIETLRAQFAEAQGAFDRDSARLGELETQHEELSLKKLEIDRVLHARREGVHELDGEIEKIERQTALVRQQIEFSREQRERAVEEKEVLVARVAELEEAVTGAASRREEADAESATLREQLESTREAHETAAQTVRETELRLEQARARAVEHTGRRTDAQTAVEKLGVAIQNVDEQLEALYARQSDAIVRHEALATRLEELRHHEGNQIDQLSTFDTERAHAAEAVENLDGELQRRQEHRQQLDVTRGGVEARLVSFRELRDSYEGFAAGVKAVMQARQEGQLAGQGVRGPIGDLLSTRPEYETAVEAALGGAMNNIVVDRADQARDAIEYLKAERAGRVTFLPLDTIRPSDSSRAVELANAPGVVGPLMDVVEFDTEIRNAVAFVIHDTLLVESLNDALTIARERSRYPRMVTLDGEVVSAAGAVTGGRSKHESRGLLGRSAEIEEMEKHIVELDANIAAVAEDIESLSERRGIAKTKLNELMAAVSSLRDALQETRSAIGQTDHEATSVQGSLESFERERDLLSARREELEADRNEKMQQTEKMESEEEASQRAIVEAQDAVAHARETESERAGELSDLRVRLANALQTIEELEREQKRIEEERAAAIAEAESRANAIQQFEENGIALENDAARLAEQATATGESREEARAKVEEAEKDRKALLDDSDALDKELKTLRDCVRESQAKAHKIEIDLRHDEDQLGFFEERIREEYDVALSSLDASAIGEDEHDDETRDQLVRDIRQKIERMGPVNLMAIEEYDALCERHSFLVEQDEDLRTAREQLLSVVRRIDERITAMFVETFKAVAENFHGYFRRLFNGGQARIYLVDEDNPLESGIEIEARPPGKKPQSISLLSGGEQAMTAIALLFSIFKAKPSPFCVLDEVDAPLDDANIGRFIEMVDEFAADTQFVVITHNKQTMAKAGGLYGVTQQERGVSQIVSVRLDQAHEHAA